AGMALGLDDPAKGAEARGSKALRLPDLTREMRDRGLAVGARDPSDGVWAKRIKARGEKRQAALRVGIHKDRSALSSALIKGKGAGLVGQDHGRAFGDRFACE